MKTAVFQYNPKCKLDDYKEHSGQTVEVLEPEFEWDDMRAIRAFDGWTGYAFLSELEPVK